MNNIQINLKSQIIKFLLVGGATFIVDYLIMVVLVEFLNVYYLISTAIGFLVGSTLNYLLSIKFIFISGKYKKRETEFIIFMIFTIMGLLLNHLIMYFSTSLILLDYKFGKIASLIIVTIFNFLTKKFIVFIK